MNERPKLSKELDEGTFRSYYYLKEELAAFCRECGLPITGGKLALTERIARHLATGEVLPAQAPAGGGGPVGKPLGMLTPKSRIEPDFVCSQTHRAFFREQIGQGFSFCVPFQKWLKANTGRTYAEAVEAYRRIMEEKKRGQTTIDRQFEYNTYIRAFFADNPGKTLPQAIRCWNYKKSLPGHNRYESSDLAALAANPGPVR